MAHDSHAHDGHGTHHSVSADRRPAFTGLLVGGLLVGLILFGVVKWTNGRFAGHGEGRAAEGGAAATPAATH